jgi:hypothetical protein
MCTPALGQHSQCDAGWSDVHAEGLFGTEPTGEGARRLSIPERVYALRKWQNVCMLVAPVLSAPLKVYVKVVPVLK